LRRAPSQANIPNWLRNGGIENPNSQQRTMTMLMMGRNHTFCIAALYVFGCADGRTDGEVSKPVTNLLTGTSVDRLEEGSGRASRKQPWRNLAFHNVWTFKVASAHSYTCTCRDGVRSWIDIRYTFPFSHINHQSAPTEMCSAFWIRSISE
jgi:hypothetical protein